jgi:hypothetical protein
MKNTVFRVLTPCSPVEGQRNFGETHASIQSRDSAVDIATGCGLDDQGFGIRVPMGQEVSLLHVFQTLGSIEPPIEWVLGALSQGVKRPGRGADHSPPTSAEIKKTWVYTSTPTYVFMGLYLIS